VILGAGLTGLSAAYHLHKLGKPYFLFEKEARAGGLCRSERRNGYTFDYTGHLLHLSRPESRVLLLGELGLGGLLASVERRSFVYSHGVYTHYPFQSHTYGLPLPVVLECVEGFVKAMLLATQKPGGKDRNVDSGRPASFDRWIVDTFGRGIAKHFMRPYNQKLWTVAPRNLTTEWMSRFVPRPSLHDVLSGALADSNDNIGYNATFLYPLEGGIETLAKAFGRKVAVATGKNAVLLDVRRRTVHFEDGTQTGYGRLISTLPLTRLVDITADVPPGIIRARKCLRAAGVYNLNIGVSGRDVSDKHWVYVPERQYPFYRFGFSHNFSSTQAPRGCSAIYAEVSYSKERPIDRRRIQRTVLDSLAHIGVLKESDKVAARFETNIPHAYVIYDVLRTPSVEEILAYYRSKDVTSTGRWGAWCYGSMEDAIWQGAAAAHGSEDLAK